MSETLSNTQKFENLIAVLADRGTLVVHPDTWSDLATSAPDIFDGLLKLVSDPGPPHWLKSAPRLVPNRYMERGQFVALPKPKKDLLRTFAEFAYGPVSVE